MLFNSFPFLLVFLPVVALGNAALRRAAGPRAAQVWLLAASLVFYAYPRPEHLPLLVGSIAFNWLVANFLRGRKALLWLGLSANIALLFE